MSPFTTVRIGAIARAAAILAVLAAVAGCSPGRRTAPPAAQARAAAPQLSMLQLQKLAAGADPSSLGLSPAGPINALPPSGPLQATGEAAIQLNAARPFADLPIQPMRPFVLKTDATDKARALHCLAQAIYYESAREPLVGQEAVAQVVLNRLRHPAYPKSVCGVVYEGAARATGCQFTFTCDGSLRYAPEPALWRRATTVAGRALAGFVDRDVGSATHYHAAYVAPYWAPALVKMTQVGQHIFYRWTGPWGEPRAFTGRYAGREELTPAILSHGGPDATAPEPRQVTLALGGEVRTYKVADPGAKGATVTPGVLLAVRRQPSRDQVAAINASLAAVEAQLDVAPAAAAAAKPASAQVAGAAAAASPAGD